MSRKIMKKQPIELIVTGILNYGCNTMTSVFAAVDAASSTKAGSERENDSSHSISYTIQNFNSINPSNIQQNQYVLQLVPHPAEFVAIGIESYQHAQHLE